jgi:hypothetical protein
VFLFLVLFRFFWIDNHVYRLRALPGLPPWTVEIKFHEKKNGKLNRIIQTDPDKNIQKNNIWVYLKQLEDRRLCCLVSYNQTSPPI